MVIARSNATKQSIGIATARLACLAMTIPARTLSGVVWAYQRTVSPALTAAFPSCGCRFAPTCSHYARAALRDHGFLAGSVLTAVRLAKCGPWHPGGDDPVPPLRRRPVCARVNPA